MDWLEFIGFASGVVGFIAVIVAAFIVSKSTTKNTTISAQKELIDTLLIDKDFQKSEIKDLQSKFTQQGKEIAGMQGQIEVLKTIPLKEISTDMKAISSEMKDIASTQHKIVEMIPATLNKAE